MKGVMQSERFNVVFLHREMNFPDMMTKALEQQIFMSFVHKMLTHNLKAEVKIHKRVMCTCKHS